MIDLQRRTQSLVQSDLGVRVIRHALHLRALRRGQVALILHYLEGDSSAQVVPLLIAGQGLLLEHAGSRRRLIPRARLLQANHGVLHIHPDLIHVLAQVQLILAQLQQTGRIVPLRGAIA